MFAIAADEANRLSNFAANDFDVVITDQKMPDGEGLTVLASARENDATPGGGSVDGWPRLNWRLKACGAVHLIS